MERRVPKEVKVQTEKKKDPGAQVIKRKGVSLIIPHPIGHFLQKNGKLEHKVMP